MCRLDYQRYAWGQCKLLASWSDVIVMRCRATMSRSLEAMQEILLSFTCAMLAGAVLRMCADVHRTRYHRGHAGTEVLGQRGAGTESARRRALRQPDESVSAHYFRRARAGPKDSARQTTGPTNEVDSDHRW